MNTTIQKETHTTPHPVRCEVIRVDETQVDCQRTGDLFIWSDRTPCDMCARAFHTIHPVAMAVRGSDKIKNSGKQEAHIDVPCPDGHVVFRLSRL